MIMTKKEIDEQLEMYDADFIDIDSELDILLDNYDINCDEELEEDQVYLIKLSDIVGVWIDYKDHNVTSFDYTYKATSLYNREVKKEVSERIKDNYTLIKYIGNGEFIEFYTGKIVNSFIEKKSNVETFIKDYKKYLNNPLAIDIENTKLVEYNINAKQKIMDNLDLEDKITYYIEDVEERAKDKLAEDYNNTLITDFDYARIEDRIYDFQNKKVKKIVQN